MERFSVNSHRILALNFQTTDTQNHYGVVRTQFNAGVTLPSSGTDIDFFGVAASSNLVPKLDRIMALAAGAAGLRSRRRRIA